MKRSTEQLKKAAEAQQRYRQRHPEKVRRYKLKHAHEHPEFGRERRRKYRKVNKGYVEQNRQYRKSNPEKHKAHSLLQSAVRHGKISKSLFCQLCLSGLRIEGHHPDYSKPLEVVWLCRICHVDIEGRSRLARGIK